MSGLSRENIKNGLQALKPVSLIIAGGGAVILYQYGASLTPFKWSTASGYGLLGLGALSYTADYVGAAFL